MIETLEQPETRYEEVIYEGVAYPVEVKERQNPKGVYHTGNACLIECVKTGVVMHHPVAKITKKFLHLIR